MYERNLKLTIALILVAKNGSVLVLDPVVLAVALGGHADPGVGVVEGAVEQAAVARLLLGTKQILETRVLLCNFVTGTGIK